MAGNQRRCLIFVCHWRLVRQCRYCWRMFSPRPQRCKILSHSVWPLLRQSSGQALRKGAFRSPPLAEEGQGEFRQQNQASRRDRLISAFLMGSFCEKPETLAFLSSLFCRAIRMMRPFLLKSDQEPPISYCGRTLGEFQKFHAKRKTMSLLTNLSISKKFAFIALSVLVVATLVVVVVNRALSRLGEDSDRAWQRLATT